jgi:arylsulfatase
LRNDPFEQHMDAPYYTIYVGEKPWTVLPSAYILQMHVKSFEDFPPRQALPGFSPQELLDCVMNAAAERHGN